MDASPSDAEQNPRAELKRAAEAAKGTARKAAEQQKDAGADRLDTVVRAVHGAAHGFESDMPQTASYIHEAADRLATVSSKLRKETVDDLIGQVGQFARNQPLAFLGGAIIAGFALSRFLKSGGEEPARWNRS